MAGGGHGHGHDDHGHGGGGGGPGLSFDLSIGGTPMGFLSLAGTAIGALICIDLIWLGWQKSTDYIGWHAVAIPFLLVIALFLGGKTVGKLFASLGCLGVAVLFAGVTLGILYSMSIKIDEVYIPRSNDPKGWLRLIVGWGWSLAYPLFTSSVAIACALFTGWLWWGKSLKSDHH